MRGGLPGRYLLLAVGYMVLMLIGLAIGSGHPLASVAALCAVLGVAAWLRHVWNEGKSR